MKDKNKEEKEKKEEKGRGDKSYETLKWNGLVIKVN